MARYYFHLHECGEVTPDEEGLECSSLDAVRREAVSAARAVMCAELSEGRLCLSCHIEVEDSAGQIALTVPFREVVALSGL